MGSPSVRVAALAFALSSWVEGLTHLRTVLLMPSLPSHDEEDVYAHEPPALAAHATWRDRIVAWFKRSGQHDVQMDDAERAFMGVVDITSALIILHMLQQPLLPFLLSPILTTLPIPRSSPGLKSIKWPQVIISTVLLSLIHEAERISVYTTVDSMRRRRDIKNRATLGDVFVRGDELRREGNEDEEKECLICAGAGADSSLSQSISSISSMATSSVPSDVLGPLEAFCTTAPQKHIAHRSCFLSWHAAYRQQRMHLVVERVELQHPVPNEANRKRARTILEAAGFMHLSRQLRFPYELPWIRPSESQAVARPTLTLTETPAGCSSPSNVPCKSLATLHTMTPPCPGCRSSVLLHFFSRPMAPSPGQEGTYSLQEAMRRLIRLWIHHWGKLVTGRTVLYRLASQWSFVMALLSVLRVSVHRTRWTHDMFDV